MGLVKPKAAPRTRTAGKPKAGALEAVAADLRDCDAGTRRRAARNLAELPEGIPALLDHLPEEANLSVRSVIFTCLVEKRSLLVAESLARLLAHEDAGLRNASIEALQSMPEEAAGAVESLLSSNDADIRIFAVNVLALTTGRGAVDRLAAILESENHINVCAAAVEGLTEIGDERTLPALQSVRARFFDNAFMRFAVDLAINRIQGR